MTPQKKVDLVSTVRPLFKAEPLETVYLSSWNQASLEAAAPRTQEGKGNPHCLNHVGFPPGGAAGLKMNCMSFLLKILLPCKTIA